MHANRLLPPNYLRTCTRALASRCLLAHRRLSTSTTATQSHLRATESRTRRPLTRGRIRIGACFRTNPTGATRDWAFHDALARFGGRRGCEEGIRLFARMCGLPLTSPSSPAYDACRFRLPASSSLDRGWFVPPLVKATARKFQPEMPSFGSALERLHQFPLLEE